MAPVKPFVAAAMCGLALAACGTKAKLIAQGGDCFQATDCADGLVCVPQKDGRRICDNDVSGVQSTLPPPPPPPDAGRRDAGPADGASDAPGPPVDAASETGSADSATE